MIQDVGIGLEILGFVILVIYGSVGRGFLLLEQHKPTKLENLGNKIPEKYHSVLFLSGLVCVFGGLLFQLSIFNSTYP